MTGFFRSARSGWLALATALAAILLTQCWAGIALRGLYADGAYYAEQMLLRRSFAIIEPARWTSQVLVQTPVVLAMWLGQDSPQAVALAFSLASNLMPLALTLACLAVLPSADRAYGLFPVLIFLAASMSAAFASVADGPTAAAYAWLLLLLILFGAPNRWRLGGILLLAAGSLRLHEAMAFLGPILAFACLWRCRSMEDRGPRIVLALAALLIATGCGVAIHDGLHPRIAANRTGLIQDMTSFRWLLVGTGQINSMALAGLTGVLVLPVIMLRPHVRTFAMSAVSLVFMAFAVLALAEPPCPACGFAARDNACLMTAPAMVLLLLLRGRSWRLPAVSATLVAMLGLAIATADGAATAGWLSYTAAMRTALATGRGVVPWRDALAHVPTPQASVLLRYAWPWTTPLMSVWLAPGPVISTIITNPPGVAWQPFDPEAVRGMLERNDLAPTRSGVAALLGR
jgi:hypothetical protein